MHAALPLKQAVIAPSMLSLLYPLDEVIDGYPREQFLSDLIDECEKDIRLCFKVGAVRVSIDFTEGAWMFAPIQGVASDWFGLYRATSVEE